jgi:hypothetical protein
MLAAVPIRTVGQAFDLLRRERVLALTATGGVRSLVGEVIGTVRGSWWAHPQGKLVYAIASALEDSDEAVSAKVVRGKVAFVHRALWPAWRRAATDPARRREAVRGLATPARALLGRVDKEGRVKLEGRAPERTELEKRALVLSASEHTPSGRHAVVLRAWEDWADAETRRLASALTVEAARGELRGAGIEL